MNDWKPGKKGNILETDAVDACIAVALSDTKTGRGYLGHFSPDATNLEEMLQTARDQAVHPAYVHMWYGGAAFVPRFGRDSAVLNTEMRQFRIHTSRILLGYGFRVRGQAWLRVGQWLTVRLIAGTEQCAMTAVPGRY